MTFTEILEMLTWARTNHVGHIKIGGTSTAPVCEATFYPNKELPTLVPTTPQDIRSRVDAALGLKFDEDDTR